jgi:uncharacterized ferredoxin-like protein
MSFSMNQCGSGDELNVRMIAVGIAIGAGIGTALGVAIDNIALGSLSVWAWVS